MKLATRNNGERDGELLVVSRDLQQAVSAQAVANTLQQAIDNWRELQPPLQALSDSLNKGLINSFRFEPQELLAPLPRAYQWIDGSAYLSHVELVRKARGAEMPESLWSDPLMYQGGSDCLLGPCEPIALADESWGIDFEAEVVVLTDDVPMGIDVKGAEQHIILLALVNDISLRNLIPNELAKGFGFFHSKPSSSFSPVVVTTDELGADWDGRKVNLPLLSYYNGELFGRPNAGLDLAFDFPQLISHAAKSRPLGAGTLLGSGTVSNHDHRVGSSCLAEKRMLEKLESGEITTPFMRFGDHVRIEMLGSNGQSIFGAISQRLEKYDRVKSG